MKTSYLLLAAAAFTFVGCTSDDYVGREIVDEQELTGEPIDFSLTVPAQTRATLSGEDAAKALNNEFVVFGVKNAVDNTAAQNVFTNYKVTYLGASTAGSSITNTNDWEYVGQTPYTNVTPNLSTQTVKYWDYSATNGYTFTAFSGKAFLGATNATVKKVTGQTDDHDNGYEITVPAGTDISQILFSDRKPVVKADYNKPVVLTFRNFGAKIRVGFYETVPGYSVKIDKFYFADGADAAVTTFAAMDDAQTDGKFVAALQNVNDNPTGTTTSNTVKVIYYKDGSYENQAQVATGSTPVYQYTLTLGNNIVNKTLTGTAAKAIWDKDDAGSYTVVYPNPDNANPMLIRCDYTLTSDDGSGETIHVKNARVTVPTQYVQWKSNYAYTYLFKISNNTNGTTGTVSGTYDQPSGDPEGLFPITFDAVTVETTDYAQETTTTVATNSVTSYAKDGYQSGKDIYFVNNATTGDHKVIAPTGIADITTASTTDAATKANVYKLEWSATGTTTTPVEGDVIAQLTGIKNGLTMTAVNPAATLSKTVPSANGTNLDFGTNGAVKFTPAAAGNYAYIYCTTKYVPATYDEAKSFESGKVYYANTASDGNGVYYTASSIVDQASYDKYLSTNGRKLYTLKTAATPGVYDVKVITVQ
jgi:hypothetical protein